MNILKSAAPDGYTHAIPQAAVVVVTPFTYKEASYDIERDFETMHKLNMGCCFGPFLLTGGTVAVATSLAPEALGDI